MPSSELDNSLPIGLAAIQLEKGANLLPSLLYFAMLPNILLRPGQSVGLVVVVQELVLQLGHVNA